MSAPNYPLRLDPLRRARWQAAADRERRKLADWIKTTCDKASTETSRPKQEEVE